MLTIFRQFSGDPPESIKILFFDNFRSIGVFIEYAGAGPLQSWSTVAASLGNTSTAAHGETYELGRRQLEGKKTTSNMSDTCMHLPLLNWPDPGTVYKIPD